MLAQLTVFLENEKGRLAAACRAISDAGSNMHTLVVADTADFGVARMLCDNPEKCAEVLREQGWRAAVSPVLGVRVPNVPGGLAQMLEFLDEIDVNVEYGYCITLSNESAVDIFKVSDDGTVEARLEQAGFEIVAPEDIYTID
ncbi:amino acid-binding protein [Adlercreutzia agrestimuris]|uniref:amino acid-binding protein n=1 Tax=Adlercreutzia agrestimuris TaxID=2941324 RepID=UPI00203F8A59|nr:amino acid-binding protein [Adlercreutzia agrestimuris]